jgi:hypothetical protein
VGVKDNFNNQTKNQIMEFKIEDTMVDTDKAAQKWDERTGSHETLYRTDENRYYIVHTSQPQGSLPSAEFVSSEAVIRWLLLTGYELPAEFKGGNGGRSR